MAGKMAWCSAVLPLVRVFLCEVFAMMAGAHASKKVFGHKRLGSVLRLWLQMMKYSQAIPPAPTMKVNHDWVVRSDAMGEGKIARIGGWFGQIGNVWESENTLNVCWFQEDVPDCFFPTHKETANLYISANETLAIAISAHLWGKQLAGSDGKTIYAHQTDSMVGVHVTRKFSAKSKNMLLATKAVALVAAHHKLHVRVSHFPGKLNVLADGISRQNLEIMRFLNPEKRTRVCITNFLKWVTSNPTPSWCEKG